MLVSVRYLIDRARHPRSRADELARLRARFAAQPSRREASEEQRAAADELRALRQELSAALAEVEACSSCAKGHPLPAGRFEGGHCCSGSTLNVFNQEQVAALKVGGTRASRLSAPRSDHAGCTFRGETGCSLDAVDRPSLCVRYMCETLRNELRHHHDWERISQLSRKLDRAFARFKEASKR